MDGIPYVDEPNTGNDDWDELLCQLKTEEEEEWASRAATDAAASVEGDDDPDDPGGGTGPHSPDPSGLGAFLTLLVDMGKRISVSVCVQLLASNVRSSAANSRSIRVVMLLGVVMYFLFLDAMGSVNVRQRSR